MTEANPLLAPSPLPFGLPAVRADRRRTLPPAFEAAMGEHRAEVAAIASEPGRPTFDNTVVALELSGRTLARAARVFFNLVLDGVHARDARDRGGVSRRSSRPTWTPSC